MSALVLSTTLPAMAQESEPLPIDEVTVRSITHEGPRVYYRQAGTTISILAADTLSRLGQFQPGNSPLILPPAAGTNEIYVAAAYYSRGTRGDRIDFLEYYDKDSLEWLGEISIPPRHTMNQSLRTLMQPTADGQYVLIQNSTPATSITVVDVVAKEFTGEINTPGCWGIYPALTGHAFTSICGDGTFATYTLTEDGSDATRTASEKIFDATDDALFTHSEQWGDKTVFVSFTGNIYVTDLQGETATLVDKFSIVDGVPGDWRPGGYQLMAILPESETLFVLMHDDGQEGSHKQASDEVWAIDLASSSVISRTPISGLTTMTAYAEHGTLYGFNYETRKLERYLTDPVNGYMPVLQSSFAAGAVPRQIEVR